MAIIIDRRESPTGKNHINRQRFLERVKKHIKRTVHESVADKGIKEIGKKEKVKIRDNDISEPNFRNDPATGQKKRVLPGNKRFSENDTEDKPEQNGGASGNEGSPDGDMIDEFAFTLSREEFLNYLFEDLELPDFVKETMKVTDNISWNRAGFTSSGSPANLNIEKTFKKSIGRRLALNRPTDEKLKELEEEIENLRKEGKDNIADALAIELMALKGRQKTIPYIDDTDLKYTLYQERPNPSSRAVMFCLMDVSYSMQEKEKDISKRFFLLLYLFLEKKYDNIDIIFVRHTHEADEVDEDTFFYDQKSGGTQISAGLSLIKEIIKERYKPSEWNIYIAQCTDGDNYPDDNPTCKKLIEELLKITQYFAYIQISEREENSYIPFMHPLFGNFSYSAWPLYKDLSENHKNIVCRKIQEKSQIWKVFSSLFEKRNA